MGTIGTASKMSGGRSFYEKSARQNDFNDGSVEVPRLNTAASPYKSSPMRKQRGADSSSNNAQSYEELAIKYYGEAKKYTGGTRLN